MKVYVSGKITGLTPATFMKNFHRAEMCLIRDGHTVMNPTVLSMNPGFSHGDYMHVCYAMVDVCDAVYMLRDWRDSKGAKLELEYARKLGKEILFEESKA